MLPPNVHRAAAAAIAARNTSFAWQPPNTTVGTLVVVTSYPDRDGRTSRRLGVVAGNDPSIRAVRILLASPVTEFATDLDLLVAAEDSGLPYALVVQAELYGWVFEEQIAGSVGAIGPVLAEAVSAALATDGESLDGFRTGAPLAGAEDPRRLFKLQELDELDVLSHEFRRWSDGAATGRRILDVALLIPPAVGTDRDSAADRFLDLLDVVDQLADGKITLPAELLDDEVLMAEIRRWDTEFGLGVSRVLTRVNLAVRTAPSPAEGTPDDLNITGADARADRVIQRALKALGTDGPSVIDICTTLTVWQRHEGGRFVFERSGKGQIVRGCARVLEEAA